MENIRYWPEMIISGIFYLLSGCFFILAFMRIETFEFISKLTDYLVPLSALFLGVSYLLGFLFHRAIPPLIITPFRLFAQTAYKASPNFIKKIYRKNIKPHVTRSARISRAKRLRLRIVVYQFGSARLMQELDQQFSWMALVRSLCVGYLLLSVSIFTWLSSAGIALQPSFLFLVLVPETILGVVYWNQRDNFISIQDAAYKEFDKNIWSFKQNSSTGPKRRKR